MITKLSTFRGTAPDGEPLVRLFRPGDSITKVAGTFIPEVRDWLGSYRSDKQKIALLINALGASEYYGQNINGDIFYWDALAHDCRNHASQQHPYIEVTGKPIPPYGYWTFLQAKPFAHHKNKDPARAFGDVVLACLNGKMRRVELIVLLDRALALANGGQGIVDRIEAGEYPDTSMGCFQAGTMVLTSTGVYIPIEDIREGDEVLTHRGGTKIVTHTMIRKHTGSAYRIKVLGERRDIVATEEHPFWVVKKEQLACSPIPSTLNQGRRQRTCTQEGKLYKKGCTGCKRSNTPKFSWVRADHLQEGDYVALPVPKFETIEPLEPSRAQARLLGYYLAEGWCVPTKAGNDMAVQFCTGLQETDVHQEIYQLLSEVGLADKATEWDVPERNGKYINVYDKDFTKLCSMHCGRGSKTKMLSVQLLAANPEVLKDFLGAYANGDGGAYKGSLYLSTASEALAEQLQIVAARCRMVSCVGEIPHKASVLVPKDTIEYRLWIGTDHSWKMEGHTSRKVAHSSKLHSQRFTYRDDQGDEWILSPVEQVDVEPYDDNVYNFSVEGDESYVVQSVAVHNCRVPYDRCTICGNVSRTRNDYCSCVRQIGMGKILEDGRQIGVINDYPRFFDISFVFIGADKTSKVMAKLGSGAVPSAVEGEMLYGHDDEMLVKAASRCTRGSGHCCHCSGKCKAGQADHSASSFVKEKRVQSTGMPARHYRMSGEQHDNEGSLTFESNATPPFQETVKLNDIDKYTDKVGSAEQDLLDFLKRNPRPEDEQVHQLAGRLGISKDQLEEKAYQMAAQLPGKHRDTPDSEFSPKQLAAGMKVEREHTDDPAVAKQIAKDHLAEIPDYYTRLKRMEEGAKKQAEVEPLYTPITKDEGLTRWLPAAGTLAGTATGMTAAGVPASHYLLGRGKRGLPRALLVEAIAALGGATGATAGLVGGSKLRQHLLDKEGQAAEALDRFITRNAHMLDEFAALPRLLEQTGEHPHPKERLVKETPKPNVGITTEASVKQAEVSLDDLFSSAPSASRRVRVWKDETTGKKTVRIGSGMGSSFEHVKTASIDPKVAQIKRSSHVKDADIDKEILPSRAVGKTAPLLSAREPSLPEEVIRELSEHPLEQALATPSAMGMALKPHEFQRLILMAAGRPELADELAGSHQVFGPSEHSCPCCQPLDREHFSGDLMRTLLPMLEGRSYLGPVVKRRIIRITITPQVHEPLTENSSLPLLSKISSAYNWYRSEMVKMATYAPEFVRDNPKLQAAVCQLGDTDIFRKQAAGLGTVGGVATVSAIPLALMYSAHQRAQREQGVPLGFVDQLAAEHPYLTAGAGAAVVRQLFKQPKVREFADQLVGAVK